MERTIVKLETSQGFAVYVNPDHITHIYHDQYTSDDPTYATLIFDGSALEGAQRVKVVIPQGGMAGLAAREAA